MRKQFMGRMRHTGKGVVALLVAASLPATPLPAQGDADPLAVVVLERGGRSYTVRDVLEARSRYDESLLRALERDPQYRALYLRSPRFASLVRRFSDWQAVNEADVPRVSEEALLAEAAAWARDRRLETKPEGVLAAHGLEIETRARLLAEQQESFGTQQLRAQMLDSVPEFFGELSCSWIRLPLVDLETGTAASPAERRALYEKLDALAQALTAGEITWEAAVEEHAVLDADRERKGALGLLRRDMTHRYEEPFLRHAFAGLGFKMPESTLIRGPIVGEQWIYLVRIESLLIRGVVDLQLVRDTVERSLRERKLQERLAELRAATEATLHVPVVLSE